MAKNKDYEKTEIGKLKETIRSLKGKLSNREKKIDQLLSEIKTLKRSLNESIVYIDDKLSDIPVEDIVKYFSDKKKGKLNEVVKLNKKVCYKCNSGHLQLTIINRRDGQFYFRKCNKCDHKTRMKHYSDDVKE